MCVWGGEWERMRMNESVGVRMYQELDLSFHDELQVLNPVCLVCMAIAFTYWERSLSPDDGLFGKKQCGLYNYSLDLHWSLFCLSLGLIIVTLICLQPPSIISSCCHQNVICFSSVWIFFNQDSQKNSFPHLIQRATKMPKYQFFPYN